ncbi:MAG: PAS domain-containing protein [Altererythrobacter sp.]|nr:PAS domain-containing protein [Altererythrobacter sp.]
MEFSPTALAMIGLLLAAWTVGAALLMIRAAQRSQKFEVLKRSSSRLSGMLEEAPAIPMLVRADGRLEVHERLAGWLGLASLPSYLSELSGGATEGLTTAQLAELTDAIKVTQKTAAPFRMSIKLDGAGRSLAFRGCAADPKIAPGGAALVWIFDFTESEGELALLREQASRAQSDFTALVGLIEAAPIPMWFRGKDANIKLVNQAYVDAVAAQSADEVVSKQIELLESHQAKSARDYAEEAATSGETVERESPATIDGQRRLLRVSDLAVGDEGIAGYAIDIEETEQIARNFRAFRQAQRAMLDQLSVGVAQFDADQKLAFANKPFIRLFDLPFGIVSDHIPFDRFLSDARDNRRTPEVRDFPAWRRERIEWFSLNEAVEEAWPLSAGQHLRIVGQPMPDGGLVLFAEDRTEQLAESATRDTLLRTRTAMLDSLFEAIAVFAPDGSLQLWNRSFAGIWGIEPEALDGHPSADKLIEAIAPNLQKSAHADAIGKIIRSATLDRKERGGRVELAGGRTLEFAGVPLPDGNGLLTVLDITDSQMAETALRERNQALEEADRVKASFLANMSYEFRTPLTSIGGFAELIQSGAAGPVSPQLEEYVQAILDSVNRLTGQVENVLDLSQGEAGMLPLSKKRLELLPFVTDIVREREQAISDKGLSLDLRGNSGGAIDADPRQLSRAIGHLLDNAIAATDRGGKILVDVARTKDGARIVISDNGSGMGKQELARLLDGLRVTADGKVERRDGLGVPLARQFVEAHGGKLTLESRKGVGTTALIMLP